MRIAIILLAAVFAWSSPAAAQSKLANAYEYTVDLTRVKNDRVYVELTPPALKESEAVFYFPKIVPGTYAIADYGRYVQDLTVVDKKGRPLPVREG